MKDITKIKKSELIKEILIAVRGGNTPITGDLFFALAFRTEKELIAIAKELHINI